MDSSNSSNEMAAHRRFSENERKIVKTLRAMSAMEIRLIMVVIDLPYAAEDVPHKGSIVRFITITPTPFQIVPDGRINVAAYGEALLPVVFAVLVRTLLEVFRNLQEHGFRGAGVG
jgi:hypothetical protein